MKRIYQTLRRIGHPVLWLAWLAALIGIDHYQDRLYWETPSIPFRPFCYPIYGDDHFRPIKNMEDEDWSWEFHREIIRALPDNEARIFVPGLVDYEGGGYGSPLHSILVAPIDFHNGYKMIGATMDAIARTMGIHTNNIHLDYWYKDDNDQFHKDERHAKQPGHVSLVCEDIEAEGSPYIFGTTLPDYGVQKK
ncbi:MAG: hypothetical protein HQL35_11935 [Alphaproteobacteria bacterium]|nr:hypothetical protein [Alphaproteobacteria bacterium]